MSEFFSEMWGSIVFCGIFWIIVMWVITNYKSSGTPQLDEEIRMEKEKKKDVESMIDVMKDQDDFLCHFCGSMNFEDKDDFHLHIAKCNDQLVNPKV